MSYRRIPSYNWLRVFEIAARLESFTQAAEQLAMSPAAVSQQIKALETHLKQPLFERKSRRVVLTAGGRAFLPVVQQSLRSIDTTAVALFGSYEQKPLSIEGSYSFTCGWLAPRLNRFQTAFPDIHLNVSTSDVHADTTYVEKDMTIRYGIGPAISEEGDRLFGENLYPIALPEIAEKIQSPRDLLDYRLIVITSHRSSWFSVLEQDPDIDLGLLDIRFADDTLVAMHMAASGWGIALARSPVGDHIGRMCGLVPCLQELAIASQQEYYLTYPSRSGLSESAKQFRQWLLDEIAAERYPV